MDKVHPSRGNTGVPPSRATRALTLAGVSLFCISVAGCIGPQSALSPGGPAAALVANLWWIMFAVAIVVTVVVTVLLVLALARARETGQRMPGRPGEGHKLITVGGVIIPTITFLGLAIITAYALQVHASAPASAKLTIQVIGHQWWWEVRYPDLGITTANEIHIPAGEPVVVRLESADVIHSFWVPGLQAKTDLIPGQPNTTWIQAAQPGTYRGQCAEFCGTQHALMAFFVIAHTSADFQNWAARERQPAAPPTNPQAQSRQQLFLGAACVDCHTVQGTSAKGTLGPDLTHLASRQTIGAGTLINDRTNLVDWVRDAQRSKPGNLMPPMNLNPADLGDIVDYLESLK